MFIERNEDNISFGNSVIIYVQYYMQAHTHTHTHIYIYIYIYILDAMSKLSQF